MRGFIFIIFKDLKCFCVGNVKQISKTIFGSLSGSEFQFSKEQFFQCLPTHEKLSNFLIECCVWRTGMQALSHNNSTLTIHFLDAARSFLVAVYAGT